MKTTRARGKKNKHPNDSVIIQIGVVVVVVFSFALLAYSIKRFLP